MIVFLSWIKWNKVCQGVLLFALVFWCSSAWLGVAALSPPRPLQASLRPQEPVPTASEGSPTNSSIRYRRCVVVGGGPVGLAAALTLSNPPHYFNVTVLEKTTDEEFVALYDPGKAYLYNVNPVRMVAASMEEL